MAVRVDVRGCPRRTRGDADEEEPGVDAARARVRRVDAALDLRFGHLDRQRTADGSCPIHADGCDVSPASWAKRMERRPAACGGDAGRAGEANAFRTVFLDRAVCTQAATTSLARRSRLRPRGRVGVILPTRRRPFIASRVDSGGSLDRFDVGERIEKRNRRHGPRLRQLAQSVGRPRTLEVANARVAFGVVSAGLLYFIGKKIGGNNNWKKVFTVFFHTYVPTIPLFIIIFILFFLMLDSFTEIDPLFFQMLSGDEDKVLSLLGPTLGYMGLLVLVTIVFVIWLFIISVKAVKILNGFSTGKAFGLIILVMFITSIVTFPFGL